jgi:ribonuclease P protein component
MSSQGLPTSARIRRRPEFQRVYNTGVRAHGKFMTVFVLSRGPGAARFGVAATRKLGSAVARNRAKRLARELFRRHTVAAGIDVIVVPRREILDASFANLEADFHSTLRRCGGGTSPNKRPDRAAGPGTHKSV